ncbi:MAG: hypothetical protein ABFC73_07610 [Clostridiaceae bacterium]
MKDIAVFTALFWSLITLSLIMMLIGIYYYFKKRAEQKKIMFARKEHIKTLSLSASEKSILEELVSRTYVIYYSYVIETAIFMLCNIYGLLFTITTFIMSFSPTIDFKNYIISFLAIFFVIIIIYTRPQRRSTQYLHAWRILNHCVLTVLYTTENTHTELPFLVGETNLSQYIAEILHKVEITFTADEDNI